METTKPQPIALVGARSPVSIISSDSDDEAEPRMILATPPSAMPSSGGASAATPPASPATLSTVTSWVTAQQPAEILAPAQPVVVSSPQPMYVIIRTPIPLPGTVGAPCFDGSNITSFLETWELLVRYHGLPEKDWVYLFPLYCTLLVEVEVEGVEVEGLPEYQGCDFAAFRKRLLREYAGEDDRQKMYSRAFLE